MYLVYFLFASRNKIMLTLVPLDIPESITLDPAVLSDISRGVDAACDHILL